MESITYALAGLHCNACVARVTQALQPLAQTVSVTLAPMQATLVAPRVDLAALQAAVAAAGRYTLAPPGESVSAPVLPVQHSVIKFARPPTPPKLSVASAPAVAIPVSEGVSAIAAAPSTWWETYRPLLLLLTYILAASVLIQWGTGAAQVTLEATMRYFMAGFFLAFSFFKLLDVRAFADAYASYDLLAGRWRPWGYIYPFVELALGVAYLVNWQPVLSNTITLLVMGFSAIGVVLAVVRRRHIQCACLGTVFKLPMSTVTIVEDVGMVLMAAMALA
jgi:copper chaperone CopZ